MIQNIAISGLKAITSASYDFGKINLILGGNSSNKSAVVDAIYLAILGEHPTLGKSNAKLWQLCRDESEGIAIQLTADEGTATFTMKKKSGKITKQWDSTLQQEYTDNIRQVATEPFHAVGQAKRLERLVQIAGDAGKESEDRLLGKARDIAKKYEIASAVTASESEAAISLLTASLKESESELRGARKALESATTPVRPEAVILGEIEKAEEAQKDDTFNILKQDFDETQSIITERKEIQRKISETIVLKLEDEIVEKLQALIPDAKHETLVARYKELREARDELADHVFQSKTREREIITWVEGLGRAKAVVKGGRCPTCGNTKDLLESVEEIYKVTAGERPKIIDRKEHEEKLKFAEESIQFLNIYGEKYCASFDKAEKNKELREDLAHHIEEFGDDETLSDALAEITSEMNEIRQKNEANREKLWHLKKELETFKERVALTKKIDVLEGSNKELREAINDLLELRGQLVETAIYAALSPANEILGKLGWRLVYSDNDIWVSFGADNEGALPIEVLSGSEFAIVCASLQVAVAKGAKLLLMDEIQVLDHNRSGVFLKAVEESGFIDQFIGIGLAGGVEYIGGAKVIEL